ncbi:hypothetical protein HWD35_20830 [Tsukamurella tyrosinosolvens]|uniref:hypothetical protein n=1 Tax=Tsukamurella tyrosinosolvens TaxID=57704 RepID=UPI001CE132B2|nr:hypothetical protein [Tsukamurella tyrosinosolvens]MCA4997171.1 hypothetical protein [Tsukamurella tyrosinosolvens]
MKAKDSGTCTTCRHHYDEGDRVEPGTITRVVDFAGRVRRTKVTGWQHAACVARGTRGQPDMLDAALLADPDRYGDLCQTCFTYHRGECA